MTIYDGLLGRIFSRGTALELLSGLNFAAPLSATPNAATNVIDIEVDTAGAGLRFNIQDPRYGAVADGETDDQAAWDAVAEAAADVRGTVYLPAGQYNIPVMTIPAGVSRVEFDQGAVLIDCYMTAVGTAGAEIVFTAPAVKGATTISIPATGLTGAWLRLTSCINMQSEDAGIDQLGHEYDAYGFFAEFVQVLAGSAGSATLSGATAWAYSNTPGADSGAFTTSTARVMNFHEGTRIVNPQFLGKNSSYNQNFQATFCKNLVVEGGTIDCEDITSQNVRFLYCLDCKVVGATLVGKRTSVPTGSTANPCVFLSSQGCTLEGCTIYYGNQGFDVDCLPDDATYRGGPSLYCGAVNCLAVDCATEGFTSHWGNYGSFFINPRVKGSPRGVRLRDRASRVDGGGLLNPDNTAGIGVLVDEAATLDSRVSGVHINGYLYNVQVAHGSAGYEALAALLGDCQCVVEENTCQNAGDHAIYVNTAPTSATMWGPTIRGNHVYTPVGDGTHINSYNNGTKVYDNHYYGIATGRSAVRYEANIKRLHVGVNWAYGVHASGFGYRGPSTATFLTDATTFPAGESEAQLIIGDLFTDAATPFQSIIRSTAAFAAPKRHGYGAHTASLGTAGATAERQTFGFYLSGSSLRVDTRDTSNAFVTHQMNIRGAGTPEGAVTAAVGSTYQRTDGGAGTCFYVKESGAGNTGWVAK